MSTALLGTAGGLVMVESIERDDPHPKDAVKPDGSKLALVNCQCRYCRQTMIDRLEYPGWSGLRV